jgi:hypothetical protein
MGRDDAEDCINPRGRSPVKIPINRERWLFSLALTFQLYIACLFIRLSIMELTDLSPIREIYAQNHSER